MHNDEPEPPPERLLILIANDPLAYRDVLGKALGILRPACEILRLRDDLQLEIDRYRPNILVENASAAILKVSLYPDRSVGTLPRCLLIEEMSDAHRLFWTAAGS